MACVEFGSIFSSLETFPERSQTFSLLWQGDFTTNHHRNARCWPSVSGSGCSSFPSFEAFLSMAGVRLPSGTVQWESSWGFPCKIPKMLGLVRGKSRNGWELGLPGYPHGHGKHPWPFSGHASHLDNSPFESMISLLNMGGFEDIFQTCQRVYPCISPHIFFACQPLYIDDFIEWIV